MYEGTALSIVTGQGTFCVEGETQGSTCKFWKFPIELMGNDTAVKFFLLLYTASLMVTPWMLCTAQVIPCVWGPSIEILGSLELCSFCGTSSRL